ncbi:MAG TPA: RNA polymerase sigma factor [Mycobacteriales bacterium]|nr:RNA polymerase sigma factor [Mycobacteriales bacterium]
MTPADDAEQFRGWVMPHLVAMTGLAARLTSPADRDDVVQEALVRAWRKRHAYDEARGTPRAWLLAIVADRARRHRARAPRPGHQLIDVADRPRDLEQSLDLDRAIGGLPRRQRLAVELHYLLGLSVPECSAVMGCSDGTVKSTLYDARHRLRRDLEEVDRDG